MAVSEHQAFGTKTKYPVFICFRGEDVRTGFLSFLEFGLQLGLVDYYVDTKEMRGEDLKILFQRIQESQLVLIIFSEKFMDSNWCIMELLESTKEMTELRRKIIPLFYKVRVSDVKEGGKLAGKQARGEEGEEGEEKAKQREKEVQDALGTVTNFMGLKYSDYLTECDFIKDIVKQVQRVLASFKLQEKEKATVKTLDGWDEETHDMSLITGENLTGELGEELETTTQKIKFFGIKQRLQKLQEKLGMECDDSNETRVIGVLGMAGIGKTTLAEKLFETGKNNFHRRMFLKEIHRISEEEKGPTELRVRLLKKLLKKTNTTITDETTHESVEKELLDGKVFLVLDDLSDKKQIESLLGNRKWIKQGSKIVIVTSDMSLVEGIVDDTYVVPELNERERLHCFYHHVFGDNIGHSIRQRNLKNLAKYFVNYAKGNPLALKVLGVELLDRDNAHWESKLRMLAHSPSKSIEDVLNVSYDGLSQKQKDAFLDVTCFFRSENHKFVTALVASEPEKGSNEIKDLADKFLIDISGGRVEMHGLLYTLGKKLASQQHHRLWNHQDIIRVLKKKPVQITIKDIRGMFLDMSEIGSNAALSKVAFEGMENLKYLKFYNSFFPREYKADYKLHFPDGLKLPLQEIRYLNWLKFPEEELPQDFNPKNLIDLKLPYSKIKRLWDGVKDTSNLKWVDLNHSIDLCDLSGLFGAQNLQSLNLEGCTELKILHAGMESLTSLVVLNLRGCTSLVSLAEMNMKSLKTLILSDCSNLEDFQVISENLEALYLDGTALRGLPPSMSKLQKLILLNLKECKMLATVPDCLGNMKALQEVILSGCSKLESFPDLQESMRRLRIFLLDGTSIKQVPKLCQNPGLSEWLHHGARGLPLLRHLCLRGNNMIQGLPLHIGQLYHLKCIDLKCCENLASVPTLPPNLQRLNAHGCKSLTTLGNPFVFLVLTDQVHSKFIFSNCHKLDEVSKTGIISYIQKKSQLMSGALDRYNLGSVLESFIGACFPGCEVPAWLSHQGNGSAMELPEFSRHWSNNGTIGVALSAVVSFTNYQDQNHRFIVKCTCEFKNLDGYLRQFVCTVGEIDPYEIESYHVFIGYTSFLQIKKQKLDSFNDDDKAYLRFEVTDSTGEEVKTCQVCKCGFSLIYQSDETESVSWEVNINVHGSEVDEINQQEETCSMGENSNNCVVSKEIVTDESSRIEEINQQEETRSIGDNSINGDSMLRTDSEESGITVNDDDSQRIEEINKQEETSLMGNNNINGDSTLRTDSEESGLTVSDEAQRIEEINQQGETNTIGDNSNHGVSMSSADSKMKKINQQGETNSDFEENESIGCVGWEFLRCIYRRTKVWFRCGGC